MQAGTLVLQRTCKSRTKANAALLLPLFISPQIASRPVRRSFNARSTFRDASQRQREQSSSSPLSDPSSSTRQSFSTRLRTRLKETPTKWYPIPIGLGIAVLVGMRFIKEQWNNDSVGDDNVRVQGPWQVHVMGALPLRTLSRIYGALNEYTLPNWFRVPGFKLYGWIFGVNFDEVERPLESYTSLSDFFMRKLKPGSRVADNSPLISPADGTVVNFGYIENRRIESIKGATYSLDALLQGTGPTISSPTNAPPPPAASTHDDHVKAHSTVKEEEFADVNGISYSLDDLMGGDVQDTATQTASSKNQRFDMTDTKVSSGNEQKDASVDASDEQHATMGEQAAVAMDVGPRSMPWTYRGVPKPGNKMFFCVVYLGPGDYHRFHSPASWVVERRRHFAGELFSVSPYVTQKLADLFVLNERVALLGRWRHGFFSMVPVGATNVGRIVINFDKDLRTNSSTRPEKPGRFTEANYASASRLLGGHPLQAFDEVGGFMLGSTIVMVFEAPENFHFTAVKGAKCKVGESLGHLA